MSQTKKYLRSQGTFSNKVKPISDASSAIKPSQVYHDDRYERISLEMASSTLSSDLKPNEVNHFSVIKTSDQDRKMKKSKVQDQTTWMKLLFIIGVVLIISALAAVSLTIFMIVRSNGSSKTSTNSVSSAWSSTAVTVAGIGLAGTSALNSLYYPYNIAFDRAGALFISDTHNNRVVKWNIGGSSGTIVAGQANAGTSLSNTDLNRPAGLVFDLNDNLYISDSYNNRVQLWYKGASFGVTVAGNGVAGSATNMLNRPRGLALDLVNGTLYIADSFNHRVMMYHINATVGIVVAGGNGSGSSITQLHTPVDVYYDRTTSSLYILNYGTHNLVRWVIGDTRWTLVVGSSTGSYGSSMWTMNGPQGMTIDSNGKIYIADTTNDRIQYYEYGQIYATTLAGITSLGGINNQLLNNPFSVRLDSQMNLFVADTNNHRIQMYMRL